MPMHNSAVLALVLALSTPAHAEDAADWRVTSAPTETNYRLQSDDSYFAVSCTDPKFGGGATFEVVLEGVDATAHSQTQVFVNGTEYDLRHGAFGVGVTDCEDCSKAFEALWAALHQPDLKWIELKRGQTTVRHPAGGGTVLGDCPSDLER